MRGGIVASLPETIDLEDLFKQIKKQPRGQMLWTTKSSEVSILTESSD